MMKVLKYFEMEKVSWMLIYELPELGKEMADFVIISGTITM